MEVLIPITFFVSIAAVMILRPISKKLGYLIEATARERAQPPAEDPMQARTALVLEHVLKRLDAIEDRMDFTERLIASRPQLDARVESRTEPRRFAPRAGDAAPAAREHLVG